MEGALKGKQISLAGPPKKGSGALERPWKGPVGAMGADFGAPCFSEIDRPPRQV